MTRRDRDEEDLKATSDSVVSAAQRIAAMEHEKTQLDAADPRVDELSVEIERLAGRLQQETVIERSITDDLTDEDERVH